jgi:hypothetical protein
MKRMVVLLRFDFSTQRKSVSQGRVNTQRRSSFRDVTFMEQISKINEIYFE